MLVALLGLNVTSVATTASWDVDEEASLRATRERERDFEEFCFLLALFFVPISLDSPPRGALRFRGARARTKRESREGTSVRVSVCGLFQRIGVLENFSLAMREVKASSVKQIFRLRV